ncbi:energy-coupling factor transporter transmembrane component T [Bacillus carboniphilus]|uniref:Energy-coupling factor transporter transmembrane component T n=1 Tax=Bacillus carboniphilus TaxID=86663 RepID=A0ABY9JTJ6_9BACI|nr:energy-coupling factor transporter transmembrane component T [Bacillus carboniphilus]WLR42716.1 energy-coupling factor transporter transmembrane component T [Bacillus carboniphilus]
MTFQLFHPLLLAVYFIGVMILCLLFLHPYFLCTSFIILLSLQFFHRDRHSLKRLLFILLMGMTIALINPLLSHRGTTILFYIRSNPVTLEAVMYGMMMGLSLVSITLAFSSYNKLMSSHQFLYLFSRVLPKVALLVMMTFRFVPSFLRHLQQLMLIHHSVGKDDTTSKKKIQSKIKKGTSLLTALLIHSFEHALQTADSMHARGYGTTKRSTYVRYRMTKNDWSWFFFLTFIGIICILGSIFNLGKLDIYPTLEPITLTTYEYILLGFFFLFISFPIWIEGKEWLWWKWQKYKNSISAIPTKKTKH